MAEARDVVVIGAGPAGSVAATLLARRGMDVLLVERRTFPRTKTCGGCLSAAAVATLRRAGLAHVLDDLGAPAVSALRLRVRGREAALGLPAGGRAIGRAPLDAALAEQAREAGAEVAMGQATVLACEPAADRRVVRIESAGVERRVEAGLVLAADGLAHSSLRELPEFASVTARSNRVGIGATGTSAGWREPPGTIVMSVGRHGYAGAVRTGADEITLAAAVDPAWLRHVGAREAVSVLWREAGGPAPCELPPPAAWTGTPALTRRSRRLAGHRLLLIGDAAGYAEPFTGEGMAWALAGAEAVVPVAERAIARWDGALALGWHREQRRVMRANQIVCRVVRPVLRSPAIMAPLTAMLTLQPRLASRVIARAQAAGALAPC